MALSRKRLRRSTLVALFMKWSPYRPWRILLSSATTPLEYQMRKSRPPSKVLRRTTVPGLLKTLMLSPRLLSGSGRPRTAVSSTTLPGAPFR